MIEHFIIVGGLRQRGVGVGARFLQTSELGQRCRTSRAQAGGKTRIGAHSRHRQHQVEGLGRRVEAAQFFQRHGAPEMGSGKIRLQRSRLLIAGERVFPAAKA